MRRSLAVLRGAKGYGWLNHYKENPEAFSKVARPTAFNWDAPTPAGLGKVNPLAVGLPNGPQVGQVSYHGKFRAVSQGEDKAPLRPSAFFELEQGGQPFGRLEFELASDILPRTVENFCLLITGQTAKGFGYKNTKIHTLQKGVALMGGDVESGDGTTSHSAYEFRYFPDENFIIPHTGRGLLR